MREKKKKQEHLVDKRLAESLNLKIAAVSAQVRQNGLLHTVLCHGTDLIYSINSPAIKTASLFVIIVLVQKDYARLSGF